MGEDREEHRARLGAVNAKGVAARLEQMALTCARCGVADLAVRIHYGGYSAPLHAEWEGCVVALQLRLAEARKAVDVTPFMQEIRCLAALVAATPDALTAALTEGARRERERIRGLELDENVRGLLKGVMHAIHHVPWSMSAWRALLAAITQVSEANTHGGAAVTEGE